ncbi:Universal stress protein F [Tritonibacter multivorans]|uniref:Universal stress protein n=1 Tax=Tritonibacter multivorans TaxID=928856 RepID=A0A0P1GXM9_9RHOB|nr:universal stress protein [Tritonibacter multivorans]MDA7420295.1 universal stress protein [Tritonibacter multivorans]CUH81878.1 Universal stress protein F [Tritonibacter multivorans]SFC45661.1 Nucleotide-binding universal stress protein, UspA family [Tritonibacter multivorans]
MTKTVLVAVDLAHREDQAALLKRAEQMADLDGATLAVVTVLPDFKMSMVSTFFSDQHTHDMAEETRKALHAFVLETLGHDDDVKHIVRMGNVYEEVLQTAKELGADLIVVGAHRPDLADYLMGPNAARVARHAKCSVLIAR